MNSNNPNLEEYKEGFSMPENYDYKSEKGLNIEIVNTISDMKGEDDFMKSFRQKAYEVFLKKEMPTWGADLSMIKFDDIHYFVKATEKKAKTWDDLPLEIKETYEKLGIPKAEREMLSGVKAQYESEVIYGSLIKKLEDQGVIFMDTDSAYKKFPEYFQKYFGKVIPITDNKFAALNSAVWSGGSFIYIPKNVKVELPLQAYFRINTKNMGQFERTLIIADEGSQITYIEGCSAPIYSEDSLHSAVVEIVCLKNSRVRYTTIQNWSKNVFNLVTKRALVYEGAVMEWIDGNFGSSITMKYPACILLGERARGEVISLAVAGSHQVLDNGAKMTHLASNTSSTVISKSISKNGGVSTYRGLVKVNQGLKNCKVRVNCDALIMDNRSSSNTYPVIDVRSDDTQISHEASVSKIDEDQLYFLMSRGLSEDLANNLIISGFIEPITKELPMEYAIELNRLINLSMEGSVG